jgi:hypothetical protein
MNALRIDPKKRDGRALDRLRDIRGRKPARGPKRPKSADPVRDQQQAEKAAARERVQPLIREAMAERDALIQEKAHGLTDSELDACWQRCKREIKRNGSYTSFSAVCESWRNERDTRIMQDRATRYQHERQWQEALRKNWESVDQKPLREKREKETAVHLKKDREALEHEDALKRELLAEERLRRTKLERAREKARMRAKMQKKGELPPEHVIEKEEVEMTELRSPRRAKSSDAERKT